MNIQGENKIQNRVLGLLPLWLVVGIFMIGPLLVMAVVSLMESNVYGGVHFKFSLSGYRQILFDTNFFDEIDGDANEDDSSEEDELVTESAK